MASCSDSNKSSCSKASKTNLSLQVVDSILVDYLDKLYLMDVSENFEEFLAFNLKTDEIIRFNSQGTIVNSIKNEKGAPEASNSIFSITFLKNKDILVGGDQLNLAIYGPDGNQKTRLKVSSLVPRGSYLVQKQLFATKDNKFVGHIPAYPDSSFSNGLLKPTLILVDPKDASKTKSMFKFPSGSKYSEDKFHGHVQMVVNFTDEELLLAYQNEPKIHLFSYRNEDLLFDRSIDLRIQDFIEIFPSSNEQSYNFDKNHRERTPGRIMQIFRNENNAYILYRKGIHESKFDNTIRSTKGLSKADPLFLMLLNDKLEILQKDIPVPLYVTDGLREVSRDGTLIGRKDPVFSDIENEHEIFYTFKLLEDH